MTVKHNCDRPGRSLENKSTSYTLKEAAGFDPRPAPPYRPKPRCSTAVVLHWFSCWGLFSLPGLLWATSGSWGFWTMLLVGFFLAFVGNLWAALCPTRNYILRRGIGIVGLMLIVNAVPCTVIPSGLLFLISVPLAPIGLMELYAKKA